MDLKECYKNGLIRKIKPDENLIKSIIEISNSKKEAVQEANITANTISAFFTLAYDSLREILEAMCVDDGFKVLNHICIGLLLKEKLSYYEYNLFEKVRMVRNDINYYGKNIDYEEGLRLIHKIIELRDELKKKFLL